MNILFIGNVKILVLFKWSYSVPPILFTMKSRMVIKFGARSSISLKRMSLWYSFLEAHLSTCYLKYRSPNKKSNGIRVCLP
jgi:hypothetical protein